MIIEFSVGNFRSIKDVQTFRMEAAAIVSKDKTIDTSNVIGISPTMKLLKSKALYGANASGKSNLHKAIVVFIQLVHESVKDEAILGNKITPFLLSTTTEKKPSFFQLVFLMKGIQYRYGFEVNQDEVISEWLFFVKGTREVKLFTRAGQEIDTSKTNFKDAHRLVSMMGKSQNGISRSNALFLTTAHVLNVKLASELISEIGKMIVVTGLSDTFYRNYSVDSMAKQEVRERTIQMLKAADIGINNLKREEVAFSEHDANGQEAKIGYKASVKSEHEKYDSKKKSVGRIDFDFVSMESEGSLKMFELTPLILKTLDEERTIIIDEFDARFHPLLTRQLVKLFNSKANKKAQLIFITHDAGLLDCDVLRRDQICFVEKDQFGASHVFDLVEFKGIRNDASFGKDYIRGKYGAIPFIGNFDELIGADEK